MSIEIINTNTILVTGLSFNLKNNDKNILPSFVNSFRRITISNIPTLGFKYIKYNSTTGDIIINNNTSKINNDMISNNIGLLNINIKTYKCLILIYLLTNNILNINEITQIDLKQILKISNIEQYFKNIIFKIDIKNNTSNIFEITTENIDIFINDVNLLNINVQLLLSNIELFDYFNSELDSNILYALKNSDLELFNLLIKQKLFSIIKYNDKIYYDSITKLENNTQFSCTFIASIGTLNNHARWGCTCPFYYIFKKDDVANLKILTDLTRDITIKLDKYILQNNVSEDIKYIIDNRWNDLNKFKLSSKLIQDRNNIFDDILQKLISEKDLIIHRFNIHDAYRNYLKEKEYIFNLEVNNKYPCGKLLYKSLKIFKKQIIDFNNIFTNINNIPYKDNNIEIYFSENLQDAIDINILNGNHTICNLIQTYGNFLLDLDFIGYKADHPLNNKFIIRLISNDFKDNINYICNYIISIIDDLIPQFEKIRYQ